LVSIRSGTKMERMTLWKEKGRETEEKPPRSIREKSRTSYGARRRSETVVRDFEKMPHVQHLRHHLQRALKRGVLHRLLRALVEDVGALEVLYGEKGGVEGNSDLVEDVAREL
jgi:hypothetical protein